MPDLSTMAHSSLRKPISRVLAVFAFFALSAVVLSVDAAAETTPPSLSTDKADYNANESVILSGEDFAPSSDVTINITAPDGNVIASDGSFGPGSDVLTTDVYGDFVFAYPLFGTHPDGTEYLGQEGTYNVEAVDESGNVLASTSFTDSHFRGGSITWQRDPGTNTVNFKVRHAWRATACSTVRLNYGEGSVSLGGPVVATNTDAAGLPYCIREATYTHTYSGEGPFTASFRSCCRIGGLSTSGSSFRVSTIVDLRGGNLGAPTSSIPIILQMAKGPNTVPLAVADLRWRPDQLPAGDLHGIQHYLLPDGRR